MKIYAIVSGTAYLIKKVSKTDKAFECSWDYETGIMTVADEPSAITIPSERYTYEEMYQKLNVQYYIDYYAGTQLQTGVTVTPTTSSQTVEPSSGYDGLANVTVEAAPLEAKTATPTTESQEIVATTEGKIGLSKVTVEAVTAAIDANIVAGNIKKGVTILGVEGTYEA
jgi:hypothetical protein